MCFPVNIVKFLRIRFTEHVRWLLLKVLRAPLYFLLTVTLVNEAT